MLEGENIVVAARKAIIRHDFSAVLTVFPILRHLKQTKPEFDQVLQVRGGGGGPWGCRLAGPPRRTAFSAQSGGQRQLPQGPGWVEALSGE